MRNKLLFGSLTALALVLVVGVTAEAQLPKQGTFAGKFGWWAVGKVYEMEKGHIYWEGEFNGTLFNDAGEGFLHGTSWVCPGYNELRDGISVESGGRCIVTDMDGDKVFTVWHGGKGTMPLKFNGDNQFVGGTGKYAGIRGNHTYRANSVPTTEQGFGLFAGEWRLP